MEFYFIALILVSLTALHAVEAPKRPPNQLFIITDQQRWDAHGCMGNKVLKKPNLDKLAAQGAPGPSKSRMSKKRLVIAS